MRARTTKLLAVTLLTLSCSTIYSQNKITIKTPEQMQWIAPDDSLPDEFQMSILQGDIDGTGPLTFRVKWAPNFLVAPHTHPKDETITVISGTIYLGQGEDQDKKTIALPAGSFVYIPANVIYYVITKNDGAVTQNTTEAPRKTIYMGDEVSGPIR